MWPLTVSSIISVILSRHKCKVFLVEHCEFSNDHLRSLNVNQVYFKITISIFYKLAHRIIAVSNGVCESLKQNSFVKLNNTKLLSTERLQLIIARLRKQNLTYLKLIIRLF